MFGRAMAATPEVRVSFLADPNRAEKLRSHGVTVNGESIHLPVVKDDATEPPDLLLVALKHHHLQAGIDLARPYVGSATAIISVMNGIESEDSLSEAFGREHVVHTVAVGMDAVRDGLSVNYSRMGRLLIGRGYRQTSTATVARVSAFLKKCDIAHEVREDVLRAIWDKFMLNVGINQLSAVLSAPYAVFQRDESAKRLLRSAMLEVVAVAGAEGIDLHATDIEPWFDIVATLSPEGKTSMLQDVSAGRKTEVEMLAGKVVELGKKHIIPTPLNEALLEMIRIKEGMAS